MKPNIIYLFAAPVTVLAKARCSPSGPVLPPPDLNGAKFAFLDSAIRDLLTQPEAELKWNTSTTSFSVQVTSANSTLYEHHRTAPIRNSTGVCQVTADTVYRVASITKVFASLALLINAPGALDTPVSRFVPELRDVHRYGDVTLRMLASQLGGVPRDGRAFDMYSEAHEMLEAGGFPKPQEMDIPTCDVLGLKPCSRSEFFDGLRTNRLVWQANDRPAYSDQGFTLLGFALQNITGKTFDVLIHDSITEPLNLTSTGLASPDLADAIIPPGEAGLFMGYDIGNFDSAAGLYSTSRDITALMRSILGHEQLSPAQTHRWLKPATFAGGMATAVGMPWEIFRLRNLTTDGRTVDLYTKSGDLPGYSAEVLLLPDYNVSATILVAGTDAYTPTVALMEVVIAELVPMLDAMAREQARRLYAGKYRGTAGGRNGSAAALELAVDDGPGLVVVSWTSGGQSILGTLSTFKGFAPGEMEARLYPIGEGGRWRMQVEGVSSAVSKENGASVLADICRPWFQVDQMRYSGYPVDEFDFEIANGVVQRVTNSGLRMLLAKV